MTFGEDVYESRGELRSVVFEIAGGHCEHPYTFGTQRMRGVDAVARCGFPAEELAHIVSVGMGGGSTRDTVNNTIAACPVHARSTDDRSSVEWRHVPAPHDPKALADWVQGWRQGAGWDV